MGVVSGILYGGRTSAPAGDTGDANVWTGTGATHYAKIESGLALASAGDVIDTGDGNLYRAIDDGGTLRAVRPEVYEGTSPTLQNRIDGDEADFAALQANGWGSPSGYTDGERGASGTITYNGTTVSMSFNGNTDGCRIAGQNPADESTGYYWAGRLTVGAVSGTYIIGALEDDGTNDQGHCRFNLVQSGAWSHFASTINYQVASNTSTSEQYVEVLAEPGAKGQVSLWIDGALVHVCLRDSGSASGAQNFDLIADTGAGATGSGSLAIRNFAQWTFT
jgi:hypothetical protein